MEIYELISLRVRMFDDGYKSGVLLHDFFGALPAFLVIQLILNHLSLLSLFQIITINFNLMSGNNREKK